MEQFLPCNIKIKMKLMIKWKRSNHKEMNICARHDTCDIITNDVIKLLRLSFEKDGSVKT